MKSRMKTRNRRQAPLAAIACDLASRAAIASLASRSSNTQIVWPLVVQAVDLVPRALTVPGSVDEGVDEVDQPSRANHFY